VREEAGYYVCTSCQERHPGPPLSYFFPAPAHYYAVPESECEARCDLQSDTCVVDGEHFYILGNVELALLDGEGHFAWTVWSSLSTENFKRTVSLWTASGRESEPPYFGWFATSLPHALYPETANLKVHVHTGPVGSRPTLELEPTEHPLAVEQRTGITMARVREFDTIIRHQGWARPA
jgi:hypothetical protein